MNPEPGNVDPSALLSQLFCRYPAVLIDSVGEHHRGARLVAYKNVTVSEDFFQGHFPGTPLMPGVLMIEALTQVAATLLLDRQSASGASRVALRGVDAAKFRRQVVPGDQLRLEVTMGRRRSRLARAHAAAYVGDQVVAEAELLLAIERELASIDPSAHVHPAARIGEGTTVGPNCVIGADVTIGRRCVIGSSAVIDGWTEIGDDTQIYSMASIGLAPQDLKYKGERTRLRIGSRNIFREFVTINRVTAGGCG
jgi:3-hydroxyacyl-[acyl-carrier-protein] dehydratase